MSQTTSDSEKTIPPLLRSSNCFNFKWPSSVKRPRSRKEKNNSSLLTVSVFQLLQLQVAFQSEVTSESGKNNSPLLTVSVFQLLQLQVAFQCEVTSESEKTIPSSSPCPSSNCFNFKWPSSVKRPRSRKKQFSPHHLVRLPTASTSSGLPV